MLSKLLKQISKRKLTTGIALVVIIGGAYLGLKGLTEDTGAIEYAMATVEKGTIVISVSGTGQVSASNQVDITSKTSGNLVYLNAEVGQAVSAGTLIGQVDAIDAAFELESAKISYEELVTVDSDDIEDAETDVEDVHINARTTLITTSSDLSDMLQMIDDVLDDYLGNNTDRSRIEEQNFRTASQSYSVAYVAVDVFQKQYSALGSETTNAEIETMVASAYSTAIVVLELSKDTKDAVVYVRARNDDMNAAMADEAYASINDAVANASTAVNNLASTRDAIKDANNALADLKDGPDALVLRSEELLLRQKEQAYTDYFIRAPFEGIIAAVFAQKGELVSSGTNIATLITKQKIAEVTLNEIDVAQIEIDQLATLIFDAVEDLTLTGKVVEIDALGTVTQGVVTYDVKIAFDTQDERIKPGMTVDASIITDRESDVVIVPNAAIQAQGEQIFVEVIRDGIPQSVPVEVGISNELSTEIVSGLEEGAQVVTARLGGDSSSQTANASQSLRIPGLGGGGGFRGGGGFISH